MCHILYACDHLLGLQAAVILLCLRRDEKWSGKVGPVESLLPIGQEWRTVVEVKEGQQVYEHIGIFVVEIYSSLNVCCTWRQAECLIKSEYKLTFHKCKRVWAAVDLCKGRSRWSTKEIFHIYLCYKVLWTVSCFGECVNGACIGYQLWQPCSTTTLPPLPSPSTSRSPASCELCCLHGEGLNVSANKKWRPNETSKKKRENFLELFNCDLSKSKLILPTHFFLL